MDKKPPPYFPQGSLSPTDPNRYKKFKLMVGLGTIVVLLLLASVGIGVYYLIMWATT